VIFGLPLVAIDTIYFTLAALSALWSMGGTLKVGRASVVVAVALAVLHLLAWLGVL